MRVLAGYRVQVTARERVSDDVQMDLGPFIRRLVLESDPGIDPATVFVAHLLGDISDVDKLFGVQRHIGRPGKEIQVVA